MVLDRKKHWPPFYIYLQTAAIAIAVWIMTHGRYQDDAYISLVYSRNLLSGNGLTWNLGEYVEGYSNFLFVILTAGLGLLGVDLVLASKIISFLGYFGLVGTLVWFTQHNYRKHFISTPNAYAHSINSALCVSMTASSSTVLAWCFGGMEGVLFAFLLTAAICMILLWLEENASKNFVFATGIMFAFAAMTRMEGAMIFGTTGIFLGIIWLFKIRNTIQFNQLCLLGLGFLIVFAPYMSWRLWYFGEWLPNTYYAKIYGIPAVMLVYAGFFQFLEFAIIPPNLVLFAVGLFIYLLYSCGKSLSLSLLYLSLIAACYVFHVIKTGGDHMPYFRYFIPLVPIFSLVIYYCARKLIVINEKYFRDVCGAIIVLSVLQFGIVQTDDNFSKGALSGLAVADYVNKNWQSGSTIAINPAGALPYLAPNHHYIDMLGLINKPIARRLFSEHEYKDLLKNIPFVPVGHMKGDGAYILSQKPDYIIFGSAFGNDQPVFISDVELYMLPEFKKNYEYREIYIDPPKYLLDSLIYSNHARLEAIRKNPKGKYSPLSVHLNDKNQLRFIYYERKR